MPDARIDRGTAACEADTLLTELPRPVFYKVKLGLSKTKKILHNVVHMSLCCSGHDTGQVYNVANMPKATT